MFKYSFFFSLILICTGIEAQNDLDAIRYSRTGVNGTSRFVAMGGAFGALGADLSCAAYNPAGLGVYRKRDICFGFGLKSSSDQGTANGRSSTTDDSRFVYNNFGISHVWQTQNDENGRHVIAFTNIQLQNFSSSVHFASYTNSTSIALDMLNIAQTKGVPDNLDFAYEGAGYNTYVLDYDSASKKYYSNVDTKRTVLQTRDIKTSGRVNELNFSYAYSYKDQFYFGASIGVPRVTYTSTTTHNEYDDKDSMRFNRTGPGQYTANYLSYLPYIDTVHGGFNSLTYTEYFNTTGTGINLKLGAVVRLTDFVRIGMHYHSPTYYSLTDTYYNTLEATFDYDKQNKISYQYPQNADAGYFSYKIITPSKIGASAAFLIKKICAIAVDYELLNYKKAQLNSSNASDFAVVNQGIKNTYAFGSNLRTGIEFNIKPVMIRAGYNMQGSPFGNSFTGTFVRHTISGGIGYRTPSDWYFDLVWLTNLTKEDYYMFTTIHQKSEIKYNNSMLAITVGKKF